MTDAAYPRRGLPRTIEILAASVGLIVTAPVLAASAVAIWAGSSGPVLFRQKRVGKGGRHFDIYKLRTMRTEAAGPQVTARDDQRVTPIGKLLRMTKLDELPELWNVVRGDMSLVGPRPEVPRYVDLADPLWQEVLEALPGLTDPVTVTLRNEEEVMANVDGDREQFYLATLQRYKLIGSAEYLRKRTWKSDLKVLFETIVAIARPRAPAPSLREIERRVEEYGDAQ
jgi:lipopolysaccharide/colanic/teichoic acid biosynthesis glycosyltransferase